MNLPKFNAEASLGPTTGIYVGKAIHFRISGGVIVRLGAVKPQQLFGLGSIFGGDCFGSTDQCIDSFCSLLPPGPQKAKCFAACQQPSVCGDCRCTCTTDCVRTCLRTCTKSTPSDILTCRGSCFPFPNNGSLSTNLGILIN
jgi:hypothetical protein